MTNIFIIMGLQIVLGAFDTLWHHELLARLPQRPSARVELSLHATREAIYAGLFMGLAWFEWHGLLAIVFTALLIIEAMITIADFLEEDRTRRLPPLERALHTVLAISFGALFACFAPILLSWAKRPTSLQFENYGAVSLGLSICSIGILAWSMRDWLAVRRMVVARRTTPPLTGDLLVVRPQVTSTLAAGTILVAGATGFIGTALIAALLKEGRRVVILTRDVMQARASFGEHIWIIDRLDSIPSETLIDAVINLAGAPILGLPWTHARRTTLVESRVAIAIALVGLMRRLHHAPRVLVSASAVGYYGLPDVTQLLHERSPSEPGRFQSDLCIAIEHEARRAEAVGVRVVRVRFGIVLGRGGGAYPGLALAARYGLGAILGTGRQPVPWIHRDDAVGLIQMALDRNDVAGPVNAVAPERVVQADFARAIASGFGRRVWIRLPGEPFKWLLGEMSELLLAGQNVLPAAAQVAGYQYRFPSINLAAHSLALQDE